MFAIIKVFGVFAVVVLMIRKKVPLGISLVSGAVLVAFLFGMGPLSTGTTVLEICSRPDTAGFVLLVSLVLAISIVLEQSGQMARLTESLRTFVTNRKIASAALPAIIGFLPMPGGALFSAPMVKAATGDMLLDNHKRVEINHWFRHVWEYSWPLYPGVIYSADLLGLQIKQFIVLQFPLTLAAIAAGFLFVMRGVRVAPSECTAAPSARRRAIALFIFNLAPFLTIIALYLVFSFPLLWSLVIAFVLSVALNIARRKVGVVQLAKSILASTRYLNFIIMAYGVKLFSGMLDSSGAIGGMTEFFSDSHFPVLAVCIALPFIIGFVAGISIVFCSATFPLIIALPAVDASPVAYIVLAFAAGFMGTMLSPLHACLALSSEYFKSSIARVIARLVPPAVGVLGVGFALWALYQHWQPF